ncbi:MAG: transporter, partial [Pseudomonadota bacterium]
MTATDVTEARRASGLPILFSATIFLSAALLFFVQPLFARLALPEIGGAPAVWTTAMLFFQSVLLTGYVYAHLSTRYLGRRAQLFVHLGIWAAALWFLPLNVPTGWSLDPSQSVAWQTLVLFGLGVGAPFALLSANAPLIQSWYAASGGPSADDPYFLYGASNFGSFTALLAFPLLAEPFLGATMIGWVFAAGFVFLGGGLFATGISTRPGATKNEAGARASALRPGVMLRWGLLAFVPSSLMLAVTSKISTDIGAMPLIPIARQVTALMRLKL